LSEVEAGVSVLKAVSQAATDVSEHRFDRVCPVEIELSAFVGEPEFDGQRLGHFPLFKLLLTFAKLFLYFPPAVLQQPFLLFLLDHFPLHFIVVIVLLSQDGRVRVLRDSWFLRDFSMSDQLMIVLRVHLVCSDF
jgi:hypothetical protein